MAIEDAISLVNAFKGEELRETIADIEEQLPPADIGKAKRVIQSYGVNLDLIQAAAAVKRASAQIDVVIHTAGILYALPYILDEGEVVERLSLGASSARSEFDLETNLRVAEFKFIHWQEKRNAVRNKTLFQDFFKLVRAKTSKRKFLYLLDTEKPKSFLKGNRDVFKVLDRNRRLADDFLKEYGRRYRTVGEYYRAHKDEVEIVDLAKEVPGFDEFKFPSRHVAKVLDNGV